MKNLRLKRLDNPWCVLSKPHTVEPTGHVIMLPVFRDLGPGLESILPIVLPICISYLVLHNNPKVAQFKSTNIYYLVVSVSQKSECHVAECLWLKVAHEGTVKLPARAVVSSGSPAGGEKCASRFIRVDVCKPQSLLLWDLPQGCLFQYKYYLFSFSFIEI